MRGEGKRSEGREEEEMNHWILLLSSVPLDSAMFILPIDSPTLLTTSRRGGMRSFMRSRPFASAKLAILCCGEKPRMATREREIKEQQLPIAQGQNLNHTSTHTNNGHTLLDRWVIILQIGWYIQCWGNLLLKVMHYNIALLPKKVM